MKKILTVATFACAMVVSVVAQAAIVRLPPTTVNSTFTTANGTYGGCMANININVAQTASNCPADGFVSFSCTGELNDPDISAKMHDAAAMAQVVGKRVRVYVDDQKKHNGYCVVDRFDVIN